MSYKVTDTTVVDQNRNINNIGIATFVGPILIGSGSSTGTPSQALQLTGSNGAYIGGNLGIGTTAPSSKLSIVGDGVLTGIITASVLVASKDPGTGIATDSTNTVFGNGWRLNNPASTTYYKLATLPIGSSGNTFDHLNINGVLGAWTNTNQTPFEIFFSNRGAFNYKYTSYGSIRSDVKILGISTNSTVEIWAQHQASAFTKLTYNISNSLQSLVVTNPVSTTTAPTGTTVFDSSTATPRFIINESDSVGIGTTNVADKLSVFGRIQIQQDSSSNNRLVLRGQPGSLFRWSIDNNGTSNDFRIFKEDDATTANGAVYLGISTGGTVTATKFSGDGSLLTNVVASSGAISISTNTTNQNQYLTYSTSFGSTTGLGATSSLLYNPFTGNIGIGSTTLNSKLSIVGDAIISGIITANSFRARGGVPGALGVNNNGYGFFGSGDNDSGMYSSADGQVEFYSNSGEIARISASGNIGVGTINPTSKLHVEGSALITGVGTIATLNSTIASLTNLGGTNVNYTGIGTIATLNSTVASLTNLGGTNINYTGIGTIATLNSTVGTLTNLGGTNINYTGVGTIATFNSTVASLTNLGGTNVNYTGVGTIATLNSTVATLTNLGGTNVNYTGIGTIATFNATTSTITNENGTNLNFSGLGTVTTLRGTNVNYTGVGTIATFNATTSTITNQNGTNLNFSGIGTVANLVGTNINYTGIITASSFSGSGTNLTSLNASNLSSGTVPAARITASSGDFTVGNNLYVVGTLSIGGTSVILSAATLLINDRDIVVGYTTDANGNDVSSDVTANHGGISVASTVGSPLISIPQQTGINSNPATYKQWMWIRQNNYTGLGTDAWISNYAVSIANTSSVQLNSRLTVGAGFTVYDTYLDAQGLRATSLNSPSVNISGLGTIANLGGTNINFSGIGTIATLNSTVATVTNLGGTNINYTGVGTIATLNSTVASLTNLGGTNVNYTGVGTIATFNATTSTITNENGTNLNFSGLGTVTTLRGTNINYTGIGTIASFNATTSTITNENGTNLNFSGLGTVANLVGTNINYTGIITANSFRGDGSNLTGLVPNTVSSSSTTAPQYIGFLTTSSGTTTSITVSTGLVFIPSSGNLGIGTTNPTSKLHAVGNTLISGVATVTSDFTVNSGTLDVDATNNRVGIGTLTQSFLLDVNGDTRIQGSNRMRFGGNVGTTNFYIQYNSTTNSLDFVAG